MFCHNPNMTDEAVRPADKGTPVTIEFDYLAHAIHQGKERAVPYIVYGNQSSLHDYSEVVYPGNLANCEKCHVKGANLLPLKKVLPMTVMQKGAVVSTTPPITAVCVGCHDSAPAKAHIALNTAPDKTETCVICHAEGREAAVSKHK